ncbi:MAG: TetR/AcrR family transcriptional regulator [Acidimicrobiia bacterium]|nr:TetR/AcrR family transcriptional regulator [Acidimicrobiia bacterium]
MTGLRDRKKQQVRRRIIQAATQLITDKGLSDTTMEEIAAASDVSVGTVYNYFGTKSALLLAGVEDETEKMVAAGMATLTSPGDDPEAAVLRLLHAYLDDFSSWDPRLLREVMGAAFQRVDGAEITSELAQLDQRLLEQMMVLLSHFHEEGKLATGVEVYDATLLVFSVFVLQLFMFISLDTYEVSDLYKQVDRQVQLAFAGLNKESEQK